jgi:hypothetical protein
MQNVDAPCSQAPRPEGDCNRNLGTIGGCEWSVPRYSPFNQVKSLQGLAGQEAPLSAMACGEEENQCICREMGPSHPRRNQSLQGVSYLCSDCPRFMRFTTLFETTFFISKMTEKSVLHNVTQTAVHKWHFSKTQNAFDKTINIHISTASYCRVSNFNRIYEIHGKVYL